MAWLPESCGPCKGTGIVHRYAPDVLLGIDGIDGDMCGAASPSSYYLCTEDAGHEGHCSLTDPVGGGFYDWPLTSDQRGR